MLIAGSVLSAWPDPRLTQAERDWLAQKGEIVFVGQTSYPPFEFIHPRRGEYTGMAIELIRWIATEFGFNAVFKPMPFAAAQAAVLDGSADALTGIFKSPDRERRFDFSNEVFSVPASIFVRKERTDILELNDLEGDTVAVQRGDYAIEFLSDSGILVEYLYTDNFPTALDAVATGSAGALIGDEQIVLYYLYASELTGAVKKIGEPLYIGSDCMAVAKGNTILISILDKGLAKARSTGVLQKINEKWLGTAYPGREEHVSRWLVPLAIALASTILIALGVIAVNIHLNRIVHQKTAELSSLNDALKASNQKLTAANAQLYRDMEERSRMEEERRKLEARMVKAQSYESMALMAGGIAHDFNKLLTSISGGITVERSGMDEG